MARNKPNETTRQIKIIKKLEVRIQSLNKTVAALPPHCGCEDEENLQALAEELLGKWEREFKKELITGVRASMDWMDPSKTEGNAED